MSVVVPFFGDAAAARTTLRALTRLETVGGDELIVVDNSPGCAFVRECGDERVRALEASVERSAYAARNEGIEAATNHWLLLLDADTRPPASLIEDYFRRPPDPECGAVAGEIVAAAHQRGVAVRWARSRGYLTLTAGRAHPHLPIAVTANVLVRRAAWQAVGGFHERMRAGAGDVDFSWRLQEAGWRVCFSADAAIEHEHRESLRELLRQVARNAAGQRWLNARHPGALPRPRLVRGLARSLGAAAAFALRDPERARLKLVDGLVVAAVNAGWLAGNAPTGPHTPVDSVVVAERFPERADAALINRIAARDVRVEAGARATDPDWRRGRRVDVAFSEDDGPARRLLDLLWVAVRHPLRALADLRERGEPDRTPLRVLAPAVRRVARSGAAEIRPLGADNRACRIARLLGLDR